MKSLNSNPLWRYVLLGHEEHLNIAQLLAAAGPAADWGLAAGCPPRARRGFDHPPCLADGRSCVSVFRPPRARLLPPVPCRWPARAGDDLVAGVGDLGAGGALSVRGVALGARTLLLWSVACWVHFVAGVGGVLGSLCCSGRWRVGFTLLLGSVAPWVPFVAGVGAVSGPARG